VIWRRCARGIEVFEARQVPYSAEELELFTKPETMLVAAAHKPGKKARRRRRQCSRPAGGSQVILGRAPIGQGGGKYLEVLKLDENNVTTLADPCLHPWADMNKTVEAEKNLKAALAIDANDDYSLFILGHLKFRAAKYDEALDAFSRAAQLSPQNAKSRITSAWRSAKKACAARRKPPCAKPFKLIPATRMRMSTCPWCILHSSRPWPSWPVAFTKGRWQPVTRARPNWKKLLGPAKTTAGGRSETVRFAGPFVPGAGRGAADLRQGENMLRQGIHEFVVTHADAASMRSPGRRVVGAGKRHHQRPASRSICAILRFIVD